MIPVYYNSGINSIVLIYQYCNQCGNANMVLKVISEIWECSNITKWKSDGGRNQSTQIDWFQTNQHISLHLFSREKKGNW